VIKNNAIENLFCLGNFEKTLFSGKHSSFFKVKFVRKLTGIFAMINRSFHLCQRVSEWCTCLDKYHQFNHGGVFLLASISEES
jgi:hypothetical protein